MVFIRTSVGFCIGAITLVFAQANTVIAQMPSTIGKIERLDDRLDQYVDAAAAIEVLAAGFTWSEGPVWISDSSKLTLEASDKATRGCLLFSDIPRNTIFKWSPGSSGTGKITTFMMPSGYTGVDFYGLEPGSNGLALDTFGRLTMCEHGDRRVSMLTPGGGKRTLVDRFEGKRLNSPNDLVFDSDGNMYFTDPPYGLPDRFDDVRRELDFCGVYRLASDGELTLLTKQFDRPNGIGLSPDQTTLYVAQSDPNNPTWTALQLSGEGTVTASREIANAGEFMDQFPGLPDGLAVHRDGTLFASGPGGVYVMTADGDLLGRLVTGQRTSNCAFDDDFKTLYITSDDKLCCVRLK